MTLDKPHQQFWKRYGVILWPVLLTVMALFAALKLGDEFRRLLWDPSDVGAVDLRHMHRWIGIWFAGEPLFQLSNAALYPPATYLMLWPLLGWVSFSTARWVWGVLSIIALGAIVILAIRISRAEKPAEKWFAALLILSINGTGVAIGSGQLILLILPALIGAALTIDRNEKSAAGHALGGILLTWGLIKPSIALPFLWLFLFRPKQWQKVGVAMFLYGVVTCLSVAAQKEHLSSVLRATFHHAASATALYPGSRNLHAVLVTLGLSDWISVASAVVFVGLGIGIYLIRRVDVWVLMGITALVTRMGGYHRVYDDGLILLAELALWRVAQAGGITPGTRVTSELLLVVNAVVMLCPARFLDYSEYAWSPGWMWICTTMQAAVWLFSLGFLIVFAGRNPRPLHTQ